MNYNHRSTGNDGSADGREPMPMEELRRLLTKLVVLEALKALMSDLGRNVSQMTAADTARPAGSTDDAPASSPSGKGEEAENCDLGKAFRLPLSPFTTPKTAPRFRLGILGCGEQGQKWLRAAKALPGVEVVVVADANLELARKVADDHDVHCACSGSMEMVAHHKLDGVIVAVQQEGHKYGVSEMLERGLHVLCGGPFGRNAEEAREMIDAAERAGRVLAVVDEYATQVSHSLRNRGERGIGIPRLVEGTWMSSIAGPGQGIPERPCYWDRADGRGAGGHLGSHLLRIGLPLLGSPPESVVARSSNGHGARTHGGRFRVDDSMFITVTAKNGAVGQFNVIWGAPILEDECRLRVIGSEGTIEIRPLEDDDEPERESCRPALLDKDREWWVGEEPVSIRGAGSLALANWVDACRDEKRLLSRAEEARLVQDVLGAAYTSAGRGGQQVWL